MAETKQPQSLQDWMRETGTSQAVLSRLVLNQTGIAISKGAMSDLLTGSRRCSLKRALALSEVTGVSVENLVEWPTARSKRILGSPKPEQVVESGR